MSLGGIYDGAGNDASRLGLHVLMVWFSEAVVSKADAGLKSVHVSEETWWVYWENSAIVGDCVEAGARPSAIKGISWPRN